MSTSQNRESVQTVIPFATTFKKATIEQPLESVSKGIIRYGKDNLYPQDLYKMYYESPIHGGIVNQKVLFVFGNGVEVVGAMAAKDEEIQENKGSKYTIDEVVANVELDLEVLEYFYLLFKKNPVSGVWAVSYLSGELMRPREDFTAFEYSENWQSGTQSPEKTNYAVYKSIFHIAEEDTACAMYIKSPAKQIKLAKNKLTTSTFPIPRYSGAIPSILADIEMNHFHHSEVINGWTNNTIVNLNNGIPDSEEQKRKIVKELSDEVSDRENKGGVTWMFNDGAERAATVTNLNGNNNDTRYLLTQEHGIQTIMIAHSVQNAALFGLEVAGKLGGITDVPFAYERFNETYVAARRKTIIDPIEQGLSILNGWENLDLQFKEFRPILDEQVEGGNEVADAINSMSPLVATKLLDNLTRNEIRALGGLPEIEGGDVISGSLPEGEPVDEEQMIDHFAAVGVDASEIKKIHSRGFDYKGTDEDYISDFISDKFQVELSANQNRILQLIANGESFKAVVDAVGTGAKDVLGNIILLKSQGLIETLETGWAVTELGQESVTTEEMISVLYTYEKRPEVSGPDILPDGRTRSFCETLINLNRAYTRDEIDQISASVGRDVWFYRGGWYHNPETDKNEPSCRHFWKQNIVIS